MTLIEHELKNDYIGDNYRTFTITWENKSDMSSGWTYSDNAAGLTAGDTTFDEFFGYYGCRLSNTGVETDKEEQTTPGTLDITQLGTLTSGDNVMIAFPRRGIKMTKNWPYITLSITDDPNKSGYQYYAHTKGSNAKDTLYLGAYKMVSGYKSLSGASPLVNLTRNQFRTGIKSTYDSSAGINRYSQISIYARWYIAALYMMKYGNPDSQSVIGQGNSLGNRVKSTGGTNGRTSASYGTTSNTTQCKLFGLEDWWGNVKEFMDCCWTTSNTQLTVDPTNSVFQDSDYSINLGGVKSGWLAIIGGTNTTMFMNLSTDGGSRTTYYTDTAYNGASCAIHAGGDSYASTYPGVFCSGGVSSSYSESNISSRLMYI